MGINEIVKSVGGSRNNLYMIPADSINFTGLNQRDIEALKTSDPEYFENLVKAFMMDSLSVQPISIFFSEGQIFVDSGNTRLTAAKVAQERLGSAVVVKLQCVLSRQTDTTNLLINQIKSNLGKDFTVLEKAKVFQTLISENDWTRDRVAKECGVSAGTVSNCLSALEFCSISSKVEEAVLSGRIKPTTLNAIRRELENENLENPKERLEELIDKAQQNGNGKITEKVTKKRTKTEKSVSASSYARNVLSNCPVTEFTYQGAIEVFPNIKPDAYPDGMVIIGLEPEEWEKMKELLKIQ